MAKKNLSSLMDGLIGAVPQAQSTSENMSEKQTEKSKAGRPRKNVDENSLKEVRATFIVNQDNLQKIKYISLVESSMLKDIVAEALSSFIENWEKENGSIRLPKSKKG